jgi:hypothetical protein
MRKRAKGQHERVKATWEGQGADKERGKGKRKALTGQGRRREVTLTALCGTARWRTPNSETNGDKVVAARNSEEASGQVHATAG